MRIKRDIFTGELVEEPSSETGIEIIYREKVKPQVKVGSPWSRQHRSNAAAVHASQAEKFTEDAKHAGIPVEYDRRTGQLLSDSQSALRAEAKRRGLYLN